MFLVLFTCDGPLFSRAYEEVRRPERKKWRRTLCDHRDSLLYITCDFDEK